MTSIKDFPDAITLLVTAFTEALERCKYRSGSLLTKVGGIKGLASFLKEDNIIMKKQRGIGPKGSAVIKATKDIIIEWVVEGAERDIEALQRK